MSTPSVGIRIRQARLARGKEWTQKHLADQAGLSQGYISAIERGEEQPSFRALDRISAALQVPLEYFVSGTTSAFTPEPGQLDGASNGTFHQHLAHLSAQWMEAALAQSAIVLQLRDELEQLRARIAALESSARHSDGIAEPSVLPRH